MSERVKEIENKKTTWLKRRLKERYPDYQVMVKTIKGRNVLTTATFNAEALRKIISLFEFRPREVNGDSCYFQTHYLLKCNPSYQALETSSAKLIAGNHMVAFGEGAVIDFTAQLYFGEPLDLAVLPCPKNDNSVDAALVLAKAIYIGEWEVMSREALFRMLG
jgi:hypothetical protein